MVSTPPRSALQWLAEQLGTAVWVTTITILEIQIDLELLPQKPLTHGVANGVRWLAAIEPGNPGFGGRSRKCRNS
jgi:hypothetical protein